MAFKPSQRKKQDNEFKEPDMIVVMNLMVCLIPLLLSCAEFVKLGTIEINLPTDSGGGGGGATNTPTEQQKKLDLKLLVTDDGYTIQTNIRGIEKGPDPNNSATIPVTPGEYDVYDGQDVKKHWPLAALNNKLTDLKKEIGEGQFADEFNIQITAANTIPYQVLIKTMDAVKAKYNEQSKEIELVLFPSISLGVNIN
ncbi:MAG: biopolymer transporter ExbD [Bacteroidetes bacterium]|nr:biopolymer transporter ExbD [Bacteroidota bacterium]